MSDDINSLKRALAYIDLLEKDNAELKAQVEKMKKSLDKYNNMNLGRPKHDARWQESYELFVKLYEGGDKVPVIVEKTGFSRRTVYRYKEYYDSLKKND